MRRPALARTAQKHRPPPILSRIAPQPLVAYSAARKLRTAYAGSAIRVRRSNDNAELDIGFNASGLLDTTALLAHTGANSGYVVKLYDQSGTTDAVQATTANQPRIVAGGVIDTVGTGVTVRPTPNYRPAAETHFVTASITAYAAATATIVGVGAMNSARTEAYGRLVSIAKNTAIDDNAAGALYVVRANTAQGIGATPAGGTSSAVTYDSPFVASAVFNGTNAKTRTNGANLTTTAHVVAMDFDRVRLGAQVIGSGSARWSGGIGDVMVFADALADVDRLAVERDLGAFYGVVVQ